MAFYIEGSFSEAALAAINGIVEAAGLAKSVPLKGMSLSREREENWVLRIPGYTKMTLRGKEPPEVIYVNWHIVVVEGAEVRAKPSLVTASTGGEPGRWDFPTAFGLREVVVGHLPEPVVTFLPHKGLEKVLASDINSGEPAYAFSVRGLSSEVAAWRRDLINELLEG